MGRGNGFSDKSDYWKCIEAALIAYLTGKVGCEVSVGDICRDVPEARERTCAAMALAQLRHEGRVVFDDKTVIEVS